MEKKKKKRVSVSEGGEPEEVRKREDSLALGMEEAVPVCVM